MPQDCVSPARGAQPVAPWFFSAVPVAAAVDVAVDGAVAVALAVCVCVVPVVFFVR